MDKNKKRKVKENIYNEIMLPLKLISNPFKRFEEIKERKKGNYIIASFFIILVGFLAIFEYRHTGFIINKFNPRKLNAVILFLSNTIPILLFILANFLITTFLDGKGKLGEVYKIVGYSLFPFTFFKLITIILTNYMVISELAIIKTIYYLGIILSFVLLFIGMVVIHEYGAFRNIFSFLFSYAVMIIVVFIILLILNLIQKMLGFSESFISEIIFRIRGY